MDHSSMSNFDRRKAKEELIRGREFAQQLRILVKKSVGNDATVIENLVSRIMNSFSNTISILDRYESQEIINPPSSWDIIKKSEGSGESCKSSSPFKDRRGCYKRRKTAHSWTRESSSLIDDGHAWRKYGQKVILNAKYPRNYYRCTHRDHGCQATKQVQRVEEDPPKYCTTYYGNHTCASLLKASEIVFDSNFDDGELLSFGSKLKEDDDDVFECFPGIGIQNSSSNYNTTTMSQEDQLTVCSHMMPVLSSSLDQSEYGEVDVLSEVMMGSVVRFDDDVLSFEF